ncbi:DUF2637 domain-containing protein [Streptomyces litchfieldiae]|uniref:DUF2637 domain-containing protein n=1 Tax=Streptomyces litchfieldiae TaxID=3075543 RepID=A0ABU2N1L2_9ACTN|nr:DUF2637 domain-containing protein [Streptomyces sp. DSM 44938]MDT0347487.1 DUF2637 domain-containing protein [Streptomyces sp. DSM 44938]
MKRTLGRIDAVLIQAVIAGALSFAHIHDLAEAAGQHGWKSWAYPVSVDLLLVAAWRCLREGRAKAAGWFWFLTALAASLGANIATAGVLDLNDVPTWLNVLVAGWPAVAFFGGTLLAHKAPPRKREPAPEAAREDPAPVITLDRPEPTVATAPEPVPSLPTAPAEEAPSAPPAPPAVNVPPALIDHAKKLAAAHESSTGKPIDPATLAARLGLPAPMAAALATHLTA